jgi:hypothetical protein
MWAWCYPHFQTQCETYISAHFPFPPHIFLEVAIAMHSETLEQLQHTTRLNLESWGYTSDIGRDGLISWYQRSGGLYYLRFSVSLISCRFRQHVPPKHRNHNTGSTSLIIFTLMYYKHIFPLFILTISIRMNKLELGVVFLIKIL